MAGSALDSSTIERDITFNRGCIEPSGKFFFFCFATADHRDGEKILVYIGVPVKNLEDLLPRTLLVYMGRVPFLPEEFSRPKERLRMLEFPSDNGVPLIESKGEIPVAPYPFCIIGVHYCFRSWTDGDFLF